MSQCDDHCCPGKTFMILKKEALGLLSCLSFEFTTT